ncbi:GPALPP motifs-containing protein 1 [Sabethes cyaneus]|uniref:GPALPP motifs-containing protein 1 n=1 Tax=Sabethes cyaneus TaxID=53552 RepID=UPI00237EC222|nr:GPALPP motifs-containing protein 1 [Sabethes cyaneus]XP_053691997.1 GPALPP motifs-containing protein 1 [Sabethes cyaneus]XP_053691998.1 GPALPP motifs-containing protein 1 [Sabethes cyaneus]XP_053691999.1 GPALPP motifs-containing protein 1 [Sabethes cyaneus]
MSDTDSSDSDSGIRFKTTSTRYKSDSTSKYSPSVVSKRLDTSHDERGHSRDNRGKNLERDWNDRQTNRRSRNSYSRSKSRSRSRENRNRQRNEKSTLRSRSRSRSRTRSRSKRERVSIRENRTLPKIVQQIPESEKQKCDSAVLILSPQNDQTEKRKTGEVSFGSTVPDALVNNKSPTDEPATENIDVEGPALPQFFSNIHSGESSNHERSSRIIGPELPAHLKINSGGLESSESELSPFSEEEHVEDDLIGPLPGSSNSKTNEELEQRALELKLKRLDNPKSITVTAREDWMLQLPDIRKVSDMGLGARQFRTRDKLEIGDRSVWTDTPCDKERKKLGCDSSHDTISKREEEHTRKKIIEYDEQQEELIRKHKKHKRDKSLLDTHQQKLEKQKKKQKNSEPMRRPFDRNIDLHANRFDEAQKKAILKKAKLLDTRFSSGASKFL